MAIYRGPGGAGDATGDATNASALALAAKDAAQASATSASASATAAANSATAADTSATNASTQATNAAGSATTASTAATNASTYATNAASSATTAASEASDAADSATAAASSATSASTDASTASTQASNASSSASSASTSASTATTKASEAATSATNAASSATAAAASATEAASVLTNAALKNASNTFTANQVVAVTNNSNAALRITQLGTGNALLVEDSANPDSSPLVVDNAGNVIQGHTSTLATKNYSGNAATPAFQQHGTGISGSTLGSTIWSSGSTSNASGLILSRSKSSTIGTNATVVSGDFLGTVSFNGDDGTSFVTAASIVATVDGTPGTNDMPGRLVFSTTADGASSPTERMRITNSGNVGIGKTAPAYKVDVTGDVNITGDFYKNGTIFSGGAKGGGSDAVFYENDQTVSTNYTITSGKSAMSTGPISVSSGVSVTIPSGSRWVIL